MSDDTPTPDLMALAESMENMDPEQIQQLLEESRIVIKPGGEVVIENLTTDMLGVAYELDPENPGIQCRVDAASEGGEPAASSDSAPEEGA